MHDRSIECTIDRSTERRAGKRAARGRANDDVTRDGDETSDQAITRSRARGEISASDEISRGGVAPRKHDGEQSASNEDEEDEDDDDD